VWRDIERFLRDRETSSASYSKRPLETLLVIA